MGVPRRFTRRAGIALGALGAAGLAFAASQSFASDHMDTAFVEFNPRYDINDVYAFPGSTPDRVALVLTTSSPLTPAGTRTAGFGDKQDVLYQLKIDNTGDAVEDLVFQVTFSGPANNQRVRVQGPEKPNETGTANTLIDGRREVQGRVNTVLGSATGTQVFAGPRDDPFFIDLEQFFRIIPDRKPESGPLSRIQKSADAFRAPGAAQDFLAGFNGLAIVIELPLAELTNDGATPRFGVWGTTSRARTSGSGE